MTAPLLYLAAACSGPGESAPRTAGATLFSRLPSSETGVAFRNDLAESRAFNVFTYRNFYNGGGVALGDLTGDGLPELMLTANQDDNRLYLNRGGFRFEDVTGAAGVAGTGFWNTGVTFADVNGDGRLDIYVCRAGTGRRGNALYVHQGLNAQGVPTFIDMAAAYGVADTGYSTQAAFFDYDRDGDLDLFLLRNSPRPASTFSERDTREARDPLGGHRLYRNDGGGQRFVDVSAAAGIYGSEIGLGLGVAVSDVDRDGWPDLYVANDFFERDYLYINRRDGTFAESLDRATASVSYFSMGLDIADVNDDGRPDIYTTDMLPEDEYRLRTTSSFEGWDVYQARIKAGYHHQFMRNMLQLNNGDGTFSDVGQMAGVARTDWTWSALIADLDLDGRKDIFVTNGLARDVTSQDYIAFLGSNETMRQATQGSRVDFMSLVRAMPSTKLPDYAFRNEGDLTFSDQSAAWGLDTPNFSHGAAYGDIDGDGALDLVVSNVHDEAFIYRNNARAQTSNHYVQIRLEGEGANRFGVGAKVTLYARDRTSYQELEPTRGFQSSVDYVLTFGIGDADAVDSVRVEWPDGRMSELTNVAANQRLTVRQEGSRALPAVRPSDRPTVLTNVTDHVALPFVHRENPFVDFDRERLIPKMVSTEGPFVTVGDVNGDGLDDLFIGGAKDQSSALLVQRENGRFVATNEALLAQERISEDLGAAFFDADGDKRADLYVVTGGSEFSNLAPALEDRLYLGDGTGGFRRTSGRIPAVSASGARAAAADFDGDGDVDLFVGGRVEPWRYGIDPPSALLRNDGHGNFRDVTQQVAPELARIGMITDALWIDVDRDRRLDLVVVGEWMPVTIFRNTGARLEPLTTPGLERSSGWWNRIAAADFTGDGRVDFVLGNLGLNTRLRASPDEPVQMYVKDFDGNGFDEQIVAYYWHGVSYPLALRDDLIRALPYLKPKYPKHTDYATQSVRDVFGQSLDDAVVKRVETFATSLARNNGDGSFTLIPLPREAQIAPVYGILASDVDRDGNQDVLLAGNFDGFKPELGRMSEGHGLLLRGDGTGGFTPVPALESGFLVPGQARDIQRVRTRRGDLYIVSRNNDRPLVFRTRPSPTVVSSLSR